MFICLGMGKMDFSSNCPNKGHKHIHPLQVLLLYLQNPSNTPSNVCKPR